MRPVPKKLFVAVAVGLLVVLPFVILETIMTKGFSAVGFPFALFGLLWVLASSFVGLCLNMVRSVKAGSPLPGIAATAIVMLVIATVWSGIVFDQMPCFMGVPNCD